jgi:hypothetical protein
MLCPRARRRPAVLGRVAGKGDRRGGDRLALENIFGAHWQTAHERVKHWAQRIAEARVTA